MFTLIICLYIYILYLISYSYGTLHETNIAPENRRLEKKIDIRKPIIFRGYVPVSFREGIFHWRLLRYTNIHPVVTGGTSACRFCIETLQLLWKPNVPPCWISRWLKARLAPPVGWSLKKRGGVGVKNYRLDTCLLLFHWLLYVYLTKS